MKKLLAILLTLVMALSVTTLSWADDTVEDCSHTDKSNQTVSYKKATDTAGNITVYFESDKDVTANYATAVYAMTDGKTVTFKGTTLRAVNNLMRAYWEVNKNTTGCDYNAERLPSNGTGALTWTIYGTVGQGEYSNSGALVLPALSGGYIYADGAYGWKNIAVKAGTADASIDSNESFDVGHSYVSGGKESTTFTGITLNGGLYVTPNGTITFNDCTFTGQLRVPNGNGKMIVNECDFTGTAGVKDSNGYVLHYQAAGTLEFTGNTVADAKYKRGLNIDNEGLTATVSGNTIGTVTDTGRSAIQITKATKLDVKDNTIDATGGNAFTLHEALATQTQPAADISIENNTITGTGYLIYDDAAANNKTFDGGKLNLTMSGNTVASTVNTTQGVKDGAVYGTSDVVTEQVSAGVTVLQTPPRYYYNSTTTTATKDDAKTSSPKTFDAGVGIYAVSALLSVTGMAYVGKKKF